ncbi:alanine racemase [Nakamurella aerolata]|uniref:alanine racemase n=1 Tax=Nakamurella aerolata TaxID=1656892 RepID=UPI0031B5CFC6
MAAPRPDSVSFARCVADIDLGAIADNFRELAARLHPSTNTLAVVKADAYGHGMVPVARTLAAAGADLFGVATLDEGIALRAAGIRQPVLAWLWPPTEDPGPALRAGVDLAVSSLAQLNAVLAADTGTGTGAGPDGAPRVHLKVDTGLGRGGAGPADIDALLQAAAAAERAGRLRVEGLMSHLASADIPGDPSVAEQAKAFIDIRQAAHLAGLRPAHVHLANTAAAIDHPDLQFTTVRLGIGLYGLNPVGTELRLRPAMTLRAAVALTKRVPGGHGVSYGLTYRTDGPSTLALVPLGYADGIPRIASSRAQVLLRDKRFRIAGRVAMDQFVIDCGDTEVAAGDPVTVFGPGDNGEPTAGEWAKHCETIDYEIVTRIGPRVPRRYPGDGGAEAVTSR